ncbi:anthranilate synthase component I [Clostridium pasteurianum]|uniref:Anthranilate synthase n=1 Tax=Clostridium pasteurianum BC1 TaxID=86416 RepID=R4K7G8_CLOPA|nr:anthranilate synthase component I [Clostridium pasteurianum]AGK96474.1 anthranilate synthase [Clostridium pasteurianum BC1]
MYNFTENTNCKSEYITKGGIKVIRTKESLKDDDSIAKISKKLVHNKGAIFASDYEYPNRYSRWEFAFTNPCLELRCFQRKFTINSLNKRGDLLLDIIACKLKEIKEVEICVESKEHIEGIVQEANEFFCEEDRSKQVSVFLIIRKIKDIFESKEDSNLGLYGAFGYDLVFQFEPEIELKKERSDKQQDLVLYLPDRLTVVDNESKDGYVLSYEFTTAKGSTEGLKRIERLNNNKIQQCENFNNESSKLGEYASIVSKALDSFRKGDLFEVVPSHLLSKEINMTADEIFYNLREINPSPYGFFINLGDKFLVGSSPEMYVRVEKNRVETCPISGTTKRGKNAIDDSEQIKKLINSNKDEEELTMCTDVDRNDKSRICIPGSVKVIGRRQIEMYSHLIHTVDHVEGYLNDEYDCIDAFLTHMWAVTITGSPKRAAIEWIEEQEKAPREWYGGAVGYILFNGDMNTGLTLRTIRIKNNIAQVRVGATLLIHSQPNEEEEETYTKAAALLESLNRKESLIKDNEKREVDFNVCKNKKILIVDHEDSFVNTLASYIKQLGAHTVTLRYDLAENVLKEDSFDAVVLSPGPGRPKRFNLSNTIKLCLNKKIPIFGVCLGMQGLIEYFGGKLKQLNYPRHGKKLNVKNDLSFNVWSDIGENLQAGLYHSIYCDNIPDSFNIIAKDEEGIAMGIQHKQLPIIAVQFHPESILTAAGNSGIKLLNNVFEELFNFYTVK